MFKQTKIAAATIALLSAAAAQNVSAVAIDESGTSAQVLIFPYYNTNNGFATGFNIRNTKNEYKSLKLRFRESKLSNDVLDFNLYLSPYDRFTVGVNVNEAGQASISTKDKSCTFPAIPAAGVAFKGNVYANSKDVDAREGYLEVIETGVVTDATVQAGILHTSAGVPKDCGVIKAAWDSGKFTKGGANAEINGVNHLNVRPAGLSAPTGGLQGWSFLLDLVNGNAFVANPAAIRNYSTVPQHYRSDDQDLFLLPSLASGSDHTSVVAQDNGRDSVLTTWPATIDYVTTTAGVAEVKLANGGNGPTASGVNPLPLAHVLAATGFANDYLILPAPENQGTDWVVTFPLRKHGIYSGVTYNPTTGFENPTRGDVEVVATFYDSEEQKSSLGDDFSPVSKSPLTLLPREVNILSFGKNGTNAVSKVLNSEYTKNVGVDYVEGWGDVDFNLNNTSASAITTAFTSGTGSTTDSTITGARGVPAIGFAAIRGSFKAGENNVVGETVPHVFKRVHGD